MEDGLKSTLTELVKTVEEKILLFGSITYNAKELNIISYNVIIINGVTQDVNNIFNSSRCLIKLYLP